MVIDLFEIFLQTFWYIIRRIIWRNKEMAANKLKAPHGSAPGVPGEDVFSLSALISLFRRIMHQTIYQNVCKNISNISITIKHAF